MMDIITGKTRPDSGTACFGQKIDLLRLTEPEIAEVGIGRKFQKPTVFEHHPVFENLELAMAGDKRVFATLFAQAVRRAARPHRRGAGHHRPGRAAPPGRRRPVPRSEAVAGDRHAADAGPPSAAGRRAGGGHDPPGDGPHRRAAQVPARAGTRWSSWSTTWTSCAPSRNA